MNTINTKGLYKAAQNFVEKGENISNNSLNNKIFKLYYEYLIGLENKPNTIILKLMYIVFLERYLLDNNKNFNTFTSEDIIDYINNCSELNWSLSYQDNNKFYIKGFCKNKSYNSHLIFNYEMEI